MEAHKLRRRQNISTVITSGRSNLVERIMATGRRRRQAKGNCAGRKGIEGHCGEEKKGDRMIRKGRRAGRHQRLLRFSGKDEKDKWKRKRAALVGEEQRMAKEGERGKRSDERGEAGGEEEEGKRTARWLPRVPTRPPRRETYAVLQSSASRASSTLGTDLRGE